MTTTQTPGTTAPAAPKLPKAKAAPVVITAPKGGDKTMAPRKGAVAKAIKATGLSLNAIARKHGQNPSQLRRLSLDQVAKVDEVRAVAIARALGAEVADLFDAPQDKLIAKPKSPAKVAFKSKATAAPKAPATAKPRASRATRAAAKAKADATAQ